MALLFSAYSVEHSDPYDVSKADTDGPHVFYRGNNIIVKAVVRKDSVAVAKTIIYNDRNNVVIRCKVDETNDTFSFKMHTVSTEEKDQFALPEKMLVLSDIEGNFKAMKMMFLGAKVMSQDFKWTYGSGHLVLLGDFFDRGLHVTECLWLLYKLEAEAEAAGGKVHFILGNHEILNLQGNAQYVRKKYLENATLIGEPYNRWYDKQTELGRWLRSKNSLEKIGDYLFCHGGLSPELVATRLSLTDINHLGRQYLGQQVETIDSEAARVIFDQYVGVYWYRGAAKNKLRTSEVKRIVANWGAKRMVVGHTLQADLTALNGGKVICVDLYHEENLRQGFMKTLLIENGVCFGIDSKGEKSAVFNIVLSNSNN